jgi:hypothetical protein
MTAPRQSLFLGCLLAACGHAPPFVWAGPDSLAPDESGNERCLALLPAAGGTCLREFCPAPPVSPDGRIGDAVSAIPWADDHTLRLLMGYEFIFKVKGGGVVRCTDTARAAS